MLVCQAEYLVEDEDVSEEVRARVCMCVGVCGWVCMCARGGGRVRAWGPAVGVRTRVRAQRPPPPPPPPPPHTHTGPFRAPQAVALSRQVGEAFKGVVQVRERDGGRDGCAR